jgi:F-type H+-transporting ATPase subunit delta
MSLRTSATRYARALLDVALRESDPQQVERDLASFVAAVNRAPDLKRALTSPRIPLATRRAVLDAVTKQIGMAAPLAKLLGLLADRGRLELFEELLAVYRERLLAHRGIVRGSVTSAVALAPEKVSALERSLSAATGKQVQLEAEVDPALVGGVVARIGSTVYDGSIRTQLQKIRQQLVEGAQ